MKVGAMSHKRRLMVAITLCGMFFSAFVGVARAECVCNATCSDCVSCQPQYQTNSACAVCYRTVPAKDSVLCTFAGAMAQVPVPLQPTTGRPRVPTVIPDAWPRPLPGTVPLPGTRPEILRRDDRFGGPSSWTVGILPGTRPESIQPNIAAFPWDSPSDPLRQSQANNMQPVPVWWILPGTRPNQTQPSVTYLETISQFEAQRGLSGFERPAVRSMGHLGLGNSSVSR